MKKYIYDSDLFNIINQLQTTKTRLSSISEDCLDLLFVYLEVPLLIELFRYAVVKQGDSLVSLIAACIQNQAPEKYYRHRIKPNLDALFLKKPEWYTRSVEAVIHFHEQSFFTEEKKPALEPKNKKQKIRQDLGFHELLARLISLNRFKKPRYDYSEEDVLTLLEGIEQLAEEDIAKYTGDDHLLRVFCTQRHGEQMIEAILPMVEDDYLSDWTKQGRPIHSAAEFGTIAAFELIMQRSERYLNATNYYSETVLMCAAQSRIDAVQKVAYLLPRMNPEQQYNPKNLHVAIKAGNSDVVTFWLNQLEDRELLLKKEYAPDERTQNNKINLFQTACQARNPVILTAVTEHLSEKQQFKIFIQSMPIIYGNDANSQSLICASEFANRLCQSLDSHPRWLTEQYEGKSLLQFALAHEAYYFVYRLLFFYDYTVTSGEVGCIADCYPYRFMQDELIDRFQALFGPAIKREKGAWSDQLQLHYSSKLRDTRVVEVNSAIHSFLRSQHVTYLADKDLDCDCASAHCPCTPSNKNTAVAAITIVGRPEYDGARQKRSKAARRTYRLIVQKQDCAESHSVLGTDEILLQRLLYGATHDAIVKTTTQELRSTYDHTEQAILALLCNQHYLQSVCEQLKEQGCKKVYAVVLEIFTKKYPCSVCQRSISLHQHRSRSQATVLDNLYVAFKTYNNSHHPDRNVDDAWQIALPQKSTLRFFTRISAWEPRASKKVKSPDKVKSRDNVDIRLHGSAPTLICDIQQYPLLDEEQLDLPKPTLFISGKGKTTPKN